MRRVPRPSLFGLEALPWVALFSALLSAGCSSCQSRAPKKAAALKPISPSEPNATPAANKPRVREAAVAGSWYPGNTQALAKRMDQLLAAAKKKALAGEVIALVSPHAGYAYSGRAAAAGYKLLAGRDIRRVIVLGVSHRVPFTGASIAEVSHYRTPLGLIPLDPVAVNRLRKTTVVKTVSGAHLREHSLEMQLPLLQRAIGQSFALVPVLLGEMSEAAYVELAAALADIVDRQTIVVASSDFTHRGKNYGFEVPAGEGTLKERLRRLDQGAVNAIVALKRRALLDYHEKTRATICGLRPIATLLELLARFGGVKAQVIERYTSGDVSKRWTSTVSYVDIAFTGSWPRRSKLEQARRAGETVFPLSEADKAALLGLARRSLEAAVRKGRFDPQVLRQQTIPASLRRRAGAFVTLSCKLGPNATCIGPGHDLRGCIGTIAPSMPVYQTVALRAASAALSDRRFPKTVSIDELSHINVEVSVLTPPRKVKSAEAIIIGRHGIILNKGGRGATFLPQVASERGWSREMTLKMLSRKAGIGQEGWREGTTFSVYEAIVFAEGER